MVTWKVCVPFHRNNVGSRGIGLLKQHAQYLVIEVKIELNLLCNFLHSVFVDINVAIDSIHGELEMLKLADVVLPIDLLSTFGHFSLKQQNNYRPQIGRTSAFFHVLLAIFREII